MRPRVLFVGRHRYSLPLSGSLALKFDALAEELELRVLASAAPGSPTRGGPFVLVPPLRPRPLDGLLFYLTLPLRVARELRRFRPDAAVAESAYEALAVLLARRLARSPVRLVLDVHGDWRTATRLYGSPLRRLLSPLADRLGDEAVRRADAVRTISTFTTELVRRAGVEPAATFPAFMDLAPFAEPPLEPLPERPRALFVGVLERYKNVDGLAEAWRRAAPRVPDAELVLVGRGTLTEVPQRLVEELPAQTRWVESVPTEGVAQALDGASLLVLPSRSEGMGRVLVEALLRGRPVLATRVGGIPDLVRDGENGVLVEPGDTAALADALAALLSDRERLERLAAGARASVEPWVASPAEYARRVRSLVEAALA